MSGGYGGFNTSVVAQMLVFIRRRKKRWNLKKQNLAVCGWLGYMWKHFVQAALQGLFHLELLSPPHAVGLSFQLLFVYTNPSDIFLSGLRIAVQISDVVQQGGLIILP